MKIQIDIEQTLFEKIEAHRKKFFSHLTKRAYIVEMLRQRAEKDMEKGK